MGKFTDVGSLWERADKHGQVVYSGKLDRNVPAGAKLWLSPNTKRTNDRQPTHRIAMIEDDATEAPSVRAPEPPVDYEQRYPPAAHVAPAVGRVVTHDGPRMPMGAPANLSRRKTFAGPGTDLDESVPF